MKINLSPAYTERVTKARADIIAQQQKIAALQTSLPEVQEEAKASARRAEAARLAANPRDEESVKAVAEANTRAELWQAEIGKVEKQIEDETTNLAPLCRAAGSLFCEIVDEVLSTIQSEVYAFHHRHFELDRTAEYHASEVDSIRFLSGMKEFHLNHFTGPTAPKWGVRPGHDDFCIQKLSELLDEHGGVRRFLFDDTSSVDLAVGR